MRSMASYTLTTSTFQVTGICTWTVCQVDLQIWAFTQFIHLLFFYIKNSRNSSYFICMYKFLLSKIRVQPTRCIQMNFIICFQPNNRRVCVLANIVTLPPNTRGLNASVTQTVLTCSENENECNVICRKYNVKVITLASGDVPANFPFFYSNRRLKTSVKVARDMPTFQVCI